MEPRTAYLAANVQAFLHVIREKESSQDDSAYTIINGGSHFNAPPWQHPWYGVPTTQGSRACGAYQFLGTTWARIATQLGLRDFSPANQDLGAIGLISGRGALDDVLAGRFQDAVLKCRPEWTSLPGASESRSSWTMEKALECYHSYGGTLAGEQPAAPIEEAKPPEPATPQPTGGPMGALALLQMFGPLLAGMIPQVKSIIQPPPGSAADHNVDLAQLLITTIINAAGVAAPPQPQGQAAPVGPSADQRQMASLAAAVEAMQKDVTLQKKVQAAIVTHPSIMPTLNVQGVADARKADVAATQAEKPFWYSPVAWMTVLLLPMVYYTVIMVLGGYANVTAETKSMVIGFIIGSVLGSMVMYFYGTTNQSVKKDETIATVATTP